MDHAEDDENPSQHGGSNNNVPYYDPQQQAFQQQLAGLLPPRQQQQHNLEQQYYYAAAYGQQQLMAQQLLAQLGQQQQQAPLLQNQQQQQPYSNINRTLQAFAPTGQPTGQFDSLPDDEEEEVSSQNQFDEEEDELNAVNEERGEADMDEDENDDIDDEENDEIDDDGKDEVDDEENDEVDDDDKVEGDDDENDDDDEMEDNSTPEDGRESQNDDVASDEDEMPTGSENAAPVSKENGGKHPSSQSVGKTLARQVGGKGMVAQRGGKGIILPDNGGETFSQGDFDSAIDDQSQNEGDAQDVPDESEVDLSQEEEDISQQEEDDIEEQEEEETKSHQGEDEVNMDVGEDDDDDNLEDKAPSGVNEDDEIEESEAGTLEQEKRVKWKAGQSLDEDTTERIQKSKPRNRKRRGRGYQRLLSDSIKMFIPLGVTADLGIAIKRTRENRIGSLYEHFPELRPQELKDADNVDEAVDEDGDEQPKEVAKPRARKRQKLKHAPQPNQFASMIDYLEAKYVQGVMVADNEDEDDEEAGGSVYSETSFLDDTGLQRTVAEQVMGQATTTKLELEDDDAFFVNVGDLEVEESDMTKQNYDPLKDVQDESKKKGKKATATMGSKNTKDTKNGTPAKGTAKKDSKSAAAKTGTEKSKTATKSKVKTEQAGKASKTESQPKVEPGVDMTSPSIVRLKDAAERLEKARDDLYNELVNEIKSWDATILPKKEVKSSKVRVAITVPQNKKAGDAISFVNPHKPDQKLRTTIPNGVEPQGKFHVQIPAPDETTDASSSTTDHNKIPRESYDKIDDFARAYDDWADAEGAYRKAIKDKDYSAHKQKRNKFDEIVLEFPKDLKTPIDKAYMQRIIRRARQNRHKRALNEAKKRQEETPDVAEINEKQEDNEGEIEDAKENDSESDESVTNQDQDNSWERNAPKRGRLFPSVAFDRNDFGRN